MYRIIYIPGGAKTVDEVTSHWGMTLDARTKTFFAIDASPPPGMPVHHNLVCIPSDQRRQVKVIQAQTLPPEALSETHYRRVRVTNDRQDVTVLFRKDLAEDDRQALVGVVCHGKA